MTGTKPLKYIYEFGPFQLHPEEHRLYKEGEIIALPPKVYDLLLYFLQNRGEVLDRERLLKAIWQESYVEEGNLTVAISMLRRALGEKPNELQFVETLPRLGYRFTAPVNEILETVVTDPTTTNINNSIPGKSNSIPRQNQKIIYVIPTILLLLIIVIVIVWKFSLSTSGNIKTDDKHTAIQKIRKLYGFVWSPILNNNNPTLVTLSNPIVYRPSNHADPELLIKKGVRLSAEETEILKNAGGARLPLRDRGNLQLVPAFNMYTGIGEAIGGFQISSMLKEVGKNVQLKQSRSINNEDLKNFDLILLGSVYSNQWSKPLSVKENFAYSDKTTIKNLDPRNGEQSEYMASFDPNTGELIEDHALISVTPGVSKDKSIMVLAGIYSEGTQAAVEFVTNINYLNELNRKLRELGADKKSPMYFQAILRVGIENSFPTKIDLVTVRELKPQ